MRRFVLLVVVPGVLFACSPAPSAAGSGTSGGGMQVTSGEPSGASSGAQGESDGGDAAPESSTTSGSSVETAGSSGGGSATAGGDEGTTGTTGELVATTTGETTGEGATGAPMTCQVSLSGCTDDHALANIACLEQVENDPESYCSDQVIFHACNNEYGSGIVSCNEMFPECSGDTSDLECMIACSSAYIECVESSGCASAADAAGTGCVAALSECQSACS